MRTIDIPDDVDDDLALLARAWRTTKGAAVRRLLQEYAQPSATSPATTALGGVAIHAIYEGQRTNATYDPVTKRVDVTAGQLAGRSFKSPSGAAIAVVQHQNPAVHPNRNGWTFWTVTDSGELLQSLRG
jgi:hypothetical protein